MIFQLVNHLPWGLSMDDKQRLYTSTIIGSVCYILIYILMTFSNFISNSILHIIVKIFWCNLAMDLYMLYIRFKHIFSIVTYKTNLLPQPLTSPQHTRENDKEQDDEKQLKDEVEQNENTDKQDEHNDEQIEPNDEQIEPNDEQIEPNDEQIEPNDEQDEIVPQQPSSFTNKLTKDNINRYIKNIKKHSLHSSIKSCDLTL